jgi:Ca2+-binding EF-hand superfamily protein
MRLGVFSALTLLALLVGGPGPAQDQTKPDDKKPTPTEKPTKGFRLDVDRLLKEYDKNGDGFLQRDEVPPYLREHFDQLDTNKDGKLSREELEQGAAYLQPRRRPSDMVLVLIESSAAHDDSQAELQRIYDVLRKLDKDNTGKITAAALKVARQDLLEERVDNIIKELDANKDGKISRDEAKGFLKTNFDRIDTNKDGFVDRQELLRAATERSVSKQEKDKEE